MKIKSVKVNELDVHVFDGRDEMGKAAAEAAASYINETIAERGEATVIFAAAPSQNELLENLALADIDWTKVRALHMDEYVGLDDDNPAGFGNFLDRAIFLKKPFKEIHYIKCAEGETAQQAIARYSDVLREYPADVILLGVGENGHLAFNDPSTADFNDPLSVKLVELEDVCRQQQVHDGCFSELNDVPKYAITLSMSLISSVPRKITVVPGEKKAAAIDKLINGPVSITCPASILKTCTGADLYLDKDSAKSALL